MKTRYKNISKATAAKVVLTLLLAIAVVVSGLYITGVFDTALMGIKSPSGFCGEELGRYLKLDRQTDVDWRFFACAVHINGKYDEAFIKNLKNKYTFHPRNETEIADGIMAVFNGRAGRKQAETYIKSLRVIDDLVKNGTFPIKGCYDYSDTWGADRDYGGDRTHEGTDIMCDAGTPIYAACSGTVTKIGWNELGGWRIGITNKNGVYFYYAHLSRYANGMQKGARVQKADMIGYVGDTGYGPKGTSGKFAPHLHFGMYMKGKAFNPYPYLCYWEG